MNSLPRMAGAPVETISPNSSAPSDFTGKSLMVLDEPNGGGRSLKKMDLAHPHFVDVCANSLSAGGDHEIKFEHNKIVLSAENGDIQIGDEYPAYNINLRSLTAINGKTSELNLDTATMNIGTSSQLCTTKITGDLQVAKAGVTNHGTITTDGDIIAGGMLYWNTGDGSQQYAVGSILIGYTQNKESPYLTITNPGQNRFVTGDTTNTGYKFYRFNGNNSYTQLNANFYLKSLSYSDNNVPGLFIRWK